MAMQIYATSRYFTLWLAGNLMSGVYKNKTILCCRWSKPHVSTPGLAGLLQLRRLLKTGLTTLHLAAADYPAICRYY